MIWLNNWSHKSCLHLCNIVNWKISRFRWYVSPGDTIERTHFWPLSRSSLRYLGRAWLTPEYNIRAQVWCRYNKTWWCLSEVLGHVLAKLWSISVCLSSLQCYLYNVWSFQSKLLEIVQESWHCWQFLSRDIGSKECFCFLKSITISLHLSALSCSLFLPDQSRAATAALWIM